MFEPTKGVFEPSGFFDKKVEEERLNKIKELIPRY